MGRILSLKNWQLFLIMEIPLFWISNEPLRFIINSTGVLIFSIWIFQIGIQGQERIVRRGLGGRNVGLFKLNCVLVPIIYVLLGLAYEPIAEGDWAEYIFLPMAVYFCFAILQIMIFSAKTLTKLEIKYEPTFGRLMLNFMLVLVGPVGIWILQPKITSLITQDSA